LTNDKLSAKLFLVFTYLCLFMQGDKDLINSIELNPRPIDVTKKFLTMECHDFEACMDSLQDSQATIKIEWMGIDKTNSLKTLVKKYPNLKATIIANKEQYLDGMEAFSSGVEFEKSNEKPDEKIRKEIQSTIEPNSTQTDVTDDQPKIFKSVKKLIEEVIANKNKKLLSEALQGKEERLPYRTIEEEPAYSLFRGCLLLDKSKLNDNPLLPQLTAELLKEALQDDCKLAVNYSYIFNIFLFSTYLVEDDSLFKELMNFFGKEQELYEKIFDNERIDRKMIEENKHDLSSMFKRALICHQTDDTLETYWFELIKNSKIIDKMDEDEDEKIKKENDIYNGLAGLLRIPIKDENIACVIDRTEKALLEIHKAVKDNSEYIELMEYYIGSIPKIYDGIDDYWKDNFPIDEFPTKIQKLIKRKLFG
jgi:hypothetical protein